MTSPSDSAEPIVALAVSYHVEQSTPSVIPRSETHTVQEIIFAVGRRIYKMSPRQHYLTLLHELPEQGSAQ